MAEISKGARLKVKRANEHIETLIQKSTPLSGDLYEITNGPARSIAILAKPDCFQLTYRPKQSITDFFSPIIGDAVNNLREAMDLWINAVDRARSGRGNLHFPFSAEWKDLKAARTYGPVEKAFPELADFIFQDIKPCKDTNLELWAATSLCNHNKHNDFVPIVSLANLRDLNIDIGAGGIGGGMEGVNIRADANNTLHIAEAHLPIFVKNDFRASIEITFPKGAVFENQPVIPTLAHMSQVISQTLDALDIFARPYL